MEKMENQITKEQLEILEQKVAANPYSFEAHVEYIKALRSVSNIELLKKAREYMLSLFPLTEELWIQWIQDEQVLNEKELPSLFEKAFEDFNYPQLWEMYCEYMIQQENDEEKILKILNRAIENLKFHFRNSKNIYSIVIEYEKKKGNLNRVKELYRELLSIPHLQLPQTWKEIQHFLSDLTEGDELKEEEMKDVEMKDLNVSKDDESTKKEEDTKKKESTKKKDLKKIDEFEKIFNKTKLKFEKIRKLDHDVRNAPKDGIPSLKLKQHWINYLNFDPSNVEMNLQLYERCIQECCLEESFWLQYLDYMKEKIPHHLERILRVCMRAVRTITNSSKLYIEYMIQLERVQADIQLVKDVYRKSLIGGITEFEDYLNIFIAYSSYLRRNEKDFHQLKNEYETMLNYLNQYFPTFNDSKLGIFCANVLGKFDKMVGRDIYNHLLSKFNDINIYYHFIEFEKIHGMDVDFIRNIYLDGIQNLEKNSSFILNFIEFEREYGTLDSFLNALKLKKDDDEKNSIPSTKKKKKKKKKQKKNQQKMEDDEGDEEMIETQKIETEILPNIETQKIEIGEDLEPKRKKQKREEESSTKESTTINKESIMNEESTIAPTIATTIATIATTIAPTIAPTIDSMKEKDASIMKKEEVERKGPGNEKLTIFAWNLSFKLTNDNLRQIFEEKGCKVKDVRLIKDFRGRSKGYAYIEMEDEKSVDIGLSLHASIIEGRQIRIDRSKSKEEQEKEKKERAVKLPKNLMQPRIVSVVKKRKRLSDEERPKQPLSNEEFKQFL